MSNITWAEALQEADTPDRRDANLWAQCFAEADGDEGKAKAAYVKAKVNGPQAATPKSVDTAPGWCPNCGAQCLLTDTFCKKCNMHMSGDFRPLTEKPSPRIQAEQPATNIFKTAKSRGVYIILGLIFGLLGFHNFYIGRYQRGAFQMVCTLVLGWFVIGLVITTIWVFVDLFTVTEDGAGDPLS